MSHQSPGRARLSAAALVQSVRTALLSHPWPHLRTNGGSAGPNLPSNPRASPTAGNRCSDSRASGNASCIRTDCPDSGSARRFVKSDRFTTKSHSDLALVRSGLKISRWSPVDAVYTLWSREAVYRAARWISRVGPHCCRWIEHEDQIRCPRCDIRRRPHPDEPVRVGMRR
jgi:hypothetical protein